MADHIATMRPDGSAVETAHARRAAPSIVTYETAPSRQVASTTRYVPAPPPPPALPNYGTARSTVVQPVARNTATRAYARPAARAATPTRRATRTAPRAVTRAAPKRKSSGWKLFGGGCAGGT